MKRQYLGDARDAFKWEYQDLLCRQLGYSELQIVPMLTPDDETNEGSLHSTKFAAASEIHDFCEMLRRSRSLDDLKQLPSMTGADYRVRLHKPETAFLDFERDAYFSNLHTESDQLVFVDPDIGFEPRGPARKTRGVCGCGKPPGPGYSRFRHLRISTQKADGTVWQDSRRHSTAPVQLYIAPPSSTTA